jgi:queuine tRNA-ribosyltransferase
MAAILEVVADALDDDPRPRYLMGVGSPIDFFTAVERGIDLFDCVLPTRVARTGQVWTDAGRLNLRNAALQDDPGPIDASCTCEACRNHSRAYIAHLFRARELLAYRLATIHNVTWTLSLLRRLRASLADRSYADLRRLITAGFDRGRSAVV